MYSPTSLVNPDQGNTPENRAICIGGAFGSLASLSQPRSRLNKSLTIFLLTTKEDRLSLGPIAASTHNLKVILGWSKQWSLFCYGFEAICQGGDMCRPTSIAAIAVEYVE